jgi:hypothetical protein
MNSIGNTTGSNGIRRITKLINVIVGVFLLGLGSIFARIQIPIKHIMHVKK